MGLRGHGGASAVWLVRPGLANRHLARVWDLGLVLFNALGVQRGSALLLAGPAWLGY